MKIWQQDWISKWALYSPNAPAIQEFENGQTLTYQQLNNLGNCIAIQMQELYSIKKGDRIVTLAEFSIPLIGLFVAAQKMGIILVPLNYRLAPAEITDIIQDAKPSMIIVEDKFKHLLSAAYDDLYFPLTKISTDDTQNLPDQLDEVDEDDPIFIIYTSGTTGLPKGVKYTHKMAFWNSINTAISLDISTKSKTINVMPPFHTGGWNVLLLPFLHHGGYTVLSKKFEADKVLNALDQMQCSIFMGVPTMLALMAQEETFDQTDLGHLDYIIVGGESMPIPLIEKYAAKGVAIRQGYGMTEVGPNLTSLHQDDAIRKKGSIGRPNFYVKHRIISESGLDAKPNEPGELWLKGPMVTSGYWQNETMTKAAFSDDGKWFKTGDIVIEDDEKYLYIVDRLKNMYISGAENVYPAEIEKVLRQLQEIKECAVIGVKDDKWGEVGKAFIVLNEPLTEENILAYCIQQLAKFKCPKYIVFVDALPKSDSGKIDRKSLKLL